MSALDTAKKLPSSRRLDPETARLALVEVEQRRIAAGLSQEDLARRAGISLVTYQRYCASSRLPRAKNLRAVARALDVSGPEAREDSWLGAALAGCAVFAERVIPPAGVSVPQVTIYLAHIELGLEQRRLARVLDDSPAWISAVVRRIEDARDINPVFDQMLEAQAGALRTMAVRT